MLTTTISHRYARAIFGAALEENKLPRVAGDLANVLALNRQDPAFLNFLLTPEVLTDGKEEFIRTVIGPWADPLTVNFLLLLMDKKRIAHLTEICRDVQQLYEEHQGLVRAERPLRGGVGRHPGGAAQAGAGPPHREGRAAGEARGSVGARRGHRSHGQESHRSQLAPRAQRARRPVAPCRRRLGREESRRVAAGSRSHDVIST